MPTVQRMLHEMSMLRFVAAALCPFLINQLAHSQSAVDAFTSQPQQFGARGIGLGDATVGDIAYAENVHRNPAALSFAQYSMLSVSNHRDWTNHVWGQNFTVPVYSSRTQALALGATVNHTGHIRPYSQLRFIEYGVDVGYSLNLATGLSLGAMISARNGKVESSTVSAGWVNLGLIYAPTPGISYGVTFRGLGRGISYSYNATEGASEARANNALPRRMEVGATMAYPSTSFRPLFRLSISGERRFQEGEVWYKGGFEIFPWEFLALRLGYIGGTKELRLGTGISIGRFKLDYGISPLHDVDRVDEFTIGFLI